MEYQSISHLANALIVDAPLIIAAQEAKIDDAHTALNTLIEKLNNTLSAPHITKPALEALKIECLAHLDIYADLRSKYKGVLDEVDSEALANFFGRTPEGKAMGKEAVKAWLDKVVEYYTSWYKETEEELDVKKTREMIKRMANVCLALLEDARWWGEDD